MDSETREMLIAIIEGQKVINAKLEAMDIRLARLEDHAEAFQKRLDGIGRRLDALDRRLDGIDRRLSRMTDQRLTNHDDVIQIKPQPAEMLTSIHYLVQKVGQHDHEIYLLRSRTQAYS